MRGIAIIIGIAAVLTYLHFLTQLVGCASWDSLLMAQLGVAFLAGTGFAESCGIPRFNRSYWRSLVTTTGMLFFMFAGVASVWRSPEMIQCVQITQANAEASSPAHRDGL